MNDPLYSHFTDDWFEFRYECSFSLEIRDYVKGIPGFWHFASGWRDDDRAAYMAIFLDRTAGKELTVTAVGGKYPPTLAYSISRA